MVKMFDQTRPAHRPVTPCHVPTPAVPRAPVEALEGRVLLAGQSAITPIIKIGAPAVGPATVDLGTLGAAPAAAAGALSYSHPSGSPSTFTEHVVHFRLTRPSNSLVVRVASTGPAPAGTELYYQLVRDVGNDGLYEPTVDGNAFVSGGSDTVPATGTQSNTPADALPADSYFLVTQLFGPSLPSGTSSLSVPYGVTLQAGAGPDVRVSYNGTALTAGDTTPSAADGTDLGEVRQGAAPVVHTFTITNTGGTPLQVSSPGFEFEAFDVDDSAIPDGTTLAPGASATLKVGLLSAAPGVKDDEIVLTTNVPYLGVFRFNIRGFVTSAGAGVGTVGTTPVPVSGTTSLKEITDGASNHPAGHVTQTFRFGLASPVNDLSLAARIVNAGDVGTLGDLRVVVARDADDDGVLSQAEFYAAGNLDEVVTSADSPQTMADHGLAAGNYFANFSVTDYNGGPAGVDIQFAADMTAAAVGGPEARVTAGTGGGAAQIADGDASPSAADGTDFGTAAAGSAGPERTFTVTNTGQTSLTLGAVTAPAGFGVTAGLPPTLAAGASAAFTVMLQTDAPGDRAGDVSFTTNVPGLSPFNFAVQGSVGTATPTPTTPTPTPTPTPSPTPVAPTGVAVSAVAATLPAVVVAGQKSAKGKATVTIQNFGATAAAGPVTVTVYASRDGVLGGGDDLPIGALTKSVKLAPGGSKALKAKLLVKAPPPADGDYVILAEATGASVGGAGLAVGLPPARQVRIERPRVDLVPAGAGGPAVSLVVGGKAGKASVPVRNAGNVPAKGTVTLDLFASTDGTLDPGKAFPVAAGLRAKASAKAGGTATLKLKVPALAAVPAGFAGGAYTLVVRLASSAFNPANASDGDVLGAMPLTIVG